MAATTSRIASFLSRVIPRKAGSSTWQRGLSVFSSAHHLGDIDARLNASHVKEVFRSMTMQDDDIHHDLTYSLSFADDQSDEAGAWQLSILSDPRMLQQLKNSRNQCILKQQSVVKQQFVDTEALPQSLSDALRPSRRAIVITETKAPFRIWNVNPAWEELCGYSFLESRGKSLGSLLKGEETDALAATNLISKLLQGEKDVGTTLVNYNKDGRRFTNRVRVGPIYDEDHNVTHFVGVLQEVKV